MTTRFAMLKFFYHFLLMHKRQAGCAAGLTLAGSLLLYSCLPAGNEAYSSKRLPMQEQHQQAAVLLAQAEDLRKRAGAAAYPAEALALVRKAAEQGLPEAQYELGRDYGGKLEYEESMQWLTAAARRGHLEAQKLLCLSYALGRGLPRDRLQAYAWCSVAQRLGAQDIDEILALLEKFLSREQLQQAENLTAEIEQNLP